MLDGGMVAPQERTRSNRLQSRVPVKARPIVLVFGPDAGLVRERAERSSAPRSRTRATRLRWRASKATSLPREPTRLVEEAHTIPLFGGKRAVWVKAGGRNIVSAVEALSARRRSIAASSSRPAISAAPRRCASLCEVAKNAAVIACYVDTERDLVRLVDDEMREARSGDRARRARRPRVADRRRPPGLAQRDPQARALCARQGQRRARRRARGGGRRLGAGARRRDRCRFRRAHRRARSRSSARRRAAGTAPGTIMCGRAASRHAAAQGAGRGRGRQLVDDGARRLHPAVALPPQERWSRRRCRAGRAARLARAMEQLAEAALNVRRTAGAGRNASAQRALLSLAVTARRKK